MYPSTTSPRSTLNQNGHRVWDRSGLKTGYRLSKQGHAWKTDDQRSHVYMLSACRANVSRSQSFAQCIGTVCLLASTELTSIHSSRWAKGMGSMHQPLRTPLIYSFGLSVCLCVGEVAWLSPHMQTHTHNCTCIELSGGSLGGYTPNTNHSVNVREAAPAFPLGLSNRSIKNRGTCADNCQSIQLHQLTASKWAAEWSTRSAN